jgi:choline dehydrogenase-like flavoprotein
VKSVGGSTVHWAGASLRFEEHEFRAQSAYGNVQRANLLDWPITLAEMEPWYAKAEDKLGVTRTNNIPGLPGNNNFKVMEAGARKVGYKEVHTGRMAINSEPRDGRGACQQIGFCFQGCKTGAKWSTLDSEIPKGEATGKLEVRPNSMAVKIEHDASGKVTGRRSRKHAAPESAGRRGRRQLDRKPASAAQQRIQLVSGRPCQQLRAGRPQLHASRDRQRLCRVRKVGAHVSRNHDGRDHSRRIAS